MVKIIKTKEELLNEIEKCKKLLPEFQERKREFELKQTANEKASDEINLKIINENLEKFEKIKGDYKEVIKLLNSNYQEERKSLTLEFMAIQNQIMCISLMIYEFENQIEKNENKIKKMNRELKKENTVFEKSEDNRLSLAF